MQALGRRIRARREALGLSVRQAAADASVTRATWNAIELGQRAEVRRRTLDSIDAGLRQPLGTSATFIGQTIGDVPGKERRLSLTIQVKPDESAQDTNAREQLARYSTTASADDVHRVLSYIDRLPPKPDVDAYVKAAVQRAISELMAQQNAPSRRPRSLKVS